MLKAMTPTTVIILFLMAGCPSLASSEDIQDQIKDEQTQRRVEIAQIAGCQEDAQWVWSLVETSVREYGGYSEPDKYQIMYLAAKDLFEPNRMMFECMNNVYTKINMGIANKLRKYVFGPGNSIGKMIHGGWVKSRLMKTRKKLEKDALEFNMEIVDPKKLEHIDALEKATIWKKTEALWRAKAAQAAAVALNALRPVGSQMTLAQIDQYYVEQEPILVKQLGSLARASLRFVLFPLTNEGAKTYVTEISNEIWQTLWAKRIQAWRELLNGRIEKLGARVVKDWEKLERRRRIEEYRKASLDLSGTKVVSAVKKSKPRRHKGPRVHNKVPQTVFSAPEPPPLKTK